MRGVSVVIPTVRLDRWLDEAVESALASVGVQVELLVVHDGVAPDPEKSWASDERVTIVHLPQRSGQAVGMDLAMARARHDLVARLDGDDLAAPDRLRRQSEFLDAHPEVVAIGSRAMRIDENGAELSELRIPAGDDIRRHLLLQNVVVHSSLMFRKDIVTGIGAYDKVLEQMDDYDLVLRLAAIGPIAVLDEVLTSYRVHSQQMSRGAAPYGPHIRRVVAGRRELRRRLGASRLRAAALNFAWIGMQYLRFYRILRPGYER